MWWSAALNGLQLLHFLETNYFYSSVLKKFQAAGMWWSVASRGAQRLHFKKQIVFIYLFIFPRRRGCDEAQRQGGLHARSSCWWPDRRVTNHAATNCNDQLLFRLGTSHAHVHIHTCTEKEKMKIQEDGETVFWLSACLCVCSFDTVCHARARARAHTHTHREIGEFRKTEKGYFDSLLGFSACSWPENGTLLG